MSDEVEYICELESISICRVCDDEATFELSQNKFVVNETDVLLITAFNRFSNNENVSHLYNMHNINRK